MKKQVIRVGNKVKIKRALWVDRVGYPLVWTMLTDEVEKDPRTFEGLKALGLHPSHTGNGITTSIAFKPTGDYKGIIREIAKLRVLERGFGGNERQIFYHPEREHDIYQGAVLEVYSKRVVKTGTRVGSSHGYDSYSGEYWEEQGFLDNCKTHVLLRTGAGEIEACNVELVAKTENITSTGFVQSSRFTS